MQSRFGNRDLQATPACDQRGSLTIQFRLDHHNLPDGQFHNQLTIHETFHGKASGNFDHGLGGRLFVQNEFCGVKSFEHSPGLRRDVL